MFLSYDGAKSLRVFDSNNGSKDKDGVGNFSYDRQITWATYGNPTRIYRSNDYDKISGYQPTQPSPPTISADKSTLAISETTVVRWNQVAGANRYTVYVQAGATDSYTANSNYFTFSKSTPGTYKIFVKAINNEIPDKPSGDSNAVEIRVMPDHTVTFKDWDGRTIKAQSVRYGGTAAAPPAPSREGYTFQSWNSGGKNLGNVTEDITVTATYQINRYTVVFKDSSGTELQRQQIEYGSAATPPVPVPAEGYVFVDWDSHEYEVVKRNLTITASYRWGNPDLPNIVKISSAVRNNDGSGYNIKVSLQNYPDANIRGRVIATLKTDAGKMVAAETQTYWLSELANSERDVFISYSGVATYAEVSVVGLMADDKTGVPLAQIARKRIDLGLEWSDWSTAAPPQGDLIISENRAEYRYRDKSTTTSSSSSMSGWTLYNTTWVWGGWSGWQNSAVSSNSNREVRTQWNEPKTEQVWYYYRYVRSDGRESSIDNIYGTPKQEIWLTYRLSDQGVASGNHSHNYGAYDNGNSYLKNWWWGEQQQTRVVTAGYTQYSYRDKQYTYYFEKWGNWADWSATSATATSNKQVEKRVTYRYKSNSTDEMQDNSGIARSVLSTVNAANKLATLLVYRQTNDDPTASQLEYVDQIMLSDIGGYSFTFTTKDEPSDATGDFIALLAVEGGQWPVYIDTIYAPAPSYTVTFLDEDGEEIDRQAITRGESAEAPMPPEKTGYDFVGWDYSTVNVQNDITSTAQYAKKQYHVVFVDWDSELIEVRQYEYGDFLNRDNVPEREGFSFVDWVDANETAVTVIDQDMILAAKYGINTYSVTFLDWNGSVINEQFVEYGAEATEPVIGDPENGMLFGGWEDGWRIYGVASDLELRPLAVYPNTVSEPQLAISGESGSTRAVTVTCATPGAKIYFTLDETIPYAYKQEDATVTNGNLYYGPVPLDVDATLIAIAYADGMNESWVAAITNTDDGDDDEPPTPPPVDPSAPALTVRNAVGTPGSIVTVEVELANNPGIAGFDFSLAFDNAKLTPVEIKGGDILPGTLTSNMNSGGDLSLIDSVTAVLGGSSDFTGNGVLFSVSFSVKEDAGESVSPLTITDNLVTNQNYQDIVLSIIQGQINIAEFKYGNIFSGADGSDTSIDIKDSVKLAQYLAGWSSAALSPTEEKAADVYPDDLINVKDAVKLAQYLAKWPGVILGVK
jgi:hypothetical protein